jgi:hypothetical protein
MVLGLGIGGLFCGALSYPFFLLLVMMTQECLIPSEYAIPIKDSDNDTLCMMGNHFSGLYNQTKTLGQLRGCEGYFYVNATAPDIASQIADECWKIFNRFYYDPEIARAQKSSQWVFYIPPILLGLSLLTLLAQNLWAKYSAPATAPAFGLTHSRHPGVEIGTQTTAETPLLADEPSESMTP